jgi:hypothetical protein
MEAFITHDYSQLGQQKKVKLYQLIPVQGGLFVLKSKMSIFKVLYCSTVQNLVQSYTKGVLGRCNVHWILGNASDTRYAISSFANESINSCLT